MVTTVNYIIAFTVIYIQFILHINCQWTDIWFDDMESNNGWTASYYTYFGYQDYGCFTGNCTLQFAGQDQDEWMYKSTNIALYSQVQLRYDLSTFDLETSTGDACKIYYAYDSNSYSLIKTIVPPSDQYHRYDDQYVAFPSAVDKTTIWIWLEADGDSSTQDYCIWDNLYLQGVLESDPTPTDDPTPSPTNNPTPSPTPSPTIFTQNPTTNPTRASFSLYETIWYDDMEQNNGWTITNPSDVFISYSSTGCTDNLCTKTSTISGIDRSTDISGYTDIMLQFDVSNYDMETGDLCKVYYAYDSRSNKVHIADYSGIDYNQRKFYPNQMLYLPSSPQSIVLWIFLEIFGDSNENCYWDNVYLKGIPVIPTKEPTSDPTKEPTSEPTKETKSPTKRPTIKANIATQPPVMREAQVANIISSTMLIESEVDSKGKTSFSTKYIVYTMISILCCCFLCVVLALLIRHKVVKSDHVKDVKQIVNAVNAPGLKNSKEIQLQRSRVYTESQYAENDDDEKGHEIERKVEGDDTTIVNVEQEKNVDDDNADKMAGCSAPELGSIGRVRGVTDGGMDKQMVERTERNHELLKEWLIQNVKLPDYYDVLVENGYESLDIIKEVTDEQELKEIGIVLKGHILKIMKEIQRLNSVKGLVE